MDVIEENIGQIVLYFLLEIIQSAHKKQKMVKKIPMI